MLSSTNRSVSNVYKIILLVVVLYGLYSSIFKPEFEMNGLHSLCYFTIQSNILVALFLLYALIYPELTRFRAVARGIAMLSISVTGAVFHFVLVPQFPDFFSAGISFTQHLLHTIAPLGFIVDWLQFDQKGQMRLKDILYWVIYPLLYWVVFTAYGNISGLYPYFFMDIGEIGISTALIWLLALTVFFTLIGFLFIGIDMALGRRK